MVRRIDPGTRLLLGVSCDLHDAAAALVADGEVVAACEEERFSRVKHDPSVPGRAAASCLATAGVDADDVDAVVFYEKPLTALGRYLASRQRRGPAGLPSFVRDTPRLLRDNLLVEHRLSKMMRGLGATRNAPVLFVEHHMSHAASAFYPSPFRDAAVLTVDALGEWSTASIGVGNGHRLDLLAELRYPDSLGLLYSLVTLYCGFEPNDGEYKLMGLAPYGEPRLLDELRRLAPISPDGSVHTDPGPLRWFSRAALRDRNLQRSFGGPPRRADEELQSHHLDLAASMQSYLEEALQAMAEHALRLTGATRLCMAGGVALNGVATGKLARSGAVEDLWVQPASGDAGGALGAALAVWHGELSHPRGVPRQVARGPRPDGMGGSRLGPAVTRDEVDRWLGAQDVDHETFEDHDALTEHVAARLADGAVVGWFSGRMEFGPRALGGRSILADPRSTTVRDRLNRSVKRREDFRPFAPAVLAELAHEWFDVEGESPYMTLVVPVRGDRLLDVDREPSTLAARASVPRSAIPACTHVDGTARVQTVDRDRAPDLHRLLGSFHSLTGCPVLLNTSFNRAGEPIVCTPDQALASARLMGLDLLVVEHAVIDLSSGDGDGDEVDGGEVLGSEAASELVS